jgi:hypothetical protein
MGENVIFPKNPAARRAYIALAVVVATFSTVALAATFPYFSPATGILKGNASTYVTTAAASSDVIGLWSGTCNSGTFLRADGSCQAAGSGSVSSVGLTMPSGFSVGGSPVTSTGTLAVTTTLNGVLKGNGSGFTTSTSADIIGLWTGTCNSGTFLRADGSCQAAGGGTPAGSTTEIQYNNAGAFGAEAAFAYDAATNTLTAGDTTTGFTLKGAPNAGGNSRALTVIGGQPGATNISGGVTIDGGPGGSSTGFPGAVTIRGGTPVDQSGANVSIIGSAGVGTNRNGGNVTLTTGAPTGTGTGGSFTLTTGGTGAGSGGQFQLNTGGTQRLLVSGGGNFTFGDVTTNPTYSFLGSGTITGTTFSGAHSGNGSALTSLDAGNISAGTLAVARGGTGVTTSTGTGNVVLSASPTLTGTVTAATVAATTVTVGGNNVCQSTGTNCPAAGAQFAATFLPDSSACNVTGGNTGYTSCSRTGAGTYAITTSFAFGGSGSGVCTATVRQTTGTLSTIFHVYASVTGSTTVTLNTYTFTISTNAMAAGDFSGTNPVQVICTDV